MNPTNSISVIIPTYNSEKFVGDVLQSIYSQTLPAYEIIIVDDGSEDNTVEIIKKMNGNIRLVEEPHQGDPACGRNIGVQIASGDLIAFLDHDDLWPANKLAIQYQKLSRFKQAGVAVGKTQIFRFRSDSQKEFYSKPKYNLLLSASLIRKELFNTIGYFDEEMELWGSDADWFARLWERGIPYHFHDDLTLYWQYHENNTSRNERKRIRAMAEVLKKSLDRRKQDTNGVVACLPPLNLV